MNYSASELHHHHSLFSGHVMPSYLMCIFLWGLQNAAILWFTRADENADMFFSRSFYFSNELFWVFCFCCLNIWDVDWMLDRQLSEKKMNEL